jgi:multidrug efflux system membrane fusion protein
MRRAIILFALLCACADEPVVSEPVIRPVRVEAVQDSGGVTERTFAGTAKAGSESRLSFKVGGTISKMSLKVGDPIKKKKLIAVLESTDLQLRVQEAKAGVDQAKAQKRNAASQYKRVKALYEANNATRQDLDASRAAKDSAAASVSVAKKRLELAKTQASYASLRAPSAGTIAKVAVEEGENVQAGQTVVILSGKGRPEVVISVPESLIGQLETGARAKVVFTSMADETFPAFCSEVGIMSGGLTTYPVVLQLEADNERVRSGMAAQVALLFGKSGAERKIFVAPKAVGEDRKGRFTFVAIPTSEGLAKVERRVVTVGDIGSEGLEIKSGLKVGDLLITAGLTYLQQDLVVRLPKGETK